MSDIDVRGLIAKGLLNLEEVFSEATWNRVKSLGDLRMPNGDAKTLWLIRAEAFGIVAYSWELQGDYRTRLGEARLDESEVIEDANDFVESVKKSIAIRQRAKLNGAQEARNVDRTEGE